MRVIFDNIELAAAAAGSAHTTDWQNFGEASHASFHLEWAGLIGTPDGTLQVQVKNNKATGATPVSKTGGLITVSGANGADSISLNNVVSEKLYRAVWTPVDVTGGTVTLSVFAKG